MNLTYYDLLGVDDHATEQEIKRAYRQTSLKFHPDRDGNSRQFRAIKTAYDVLSDPVQRSAYDAELTGSSPVQDATVDPDGAAEPAWGSDSVWEDGSVTSPTPSWPASGCDPAEDVAWQIRIREQQKAAQQAWRDQIAANSRAATVNRRRGDDRLVLGLALTVCVTGVVPWAIGRYLARDTLLHPRNAAVFDPALRGVWRYGLADWAIGCAGVLALAALFILVRPWAGRVAHVVVAFLVLGVAVAGIGPYSRGQWAKQEAVTASRLRNEVYPFPAYEPTCGRASASFGTSPSQPGKPEVTYTLFSTRSGTSKSGCNSLELWEGWRQVKQVNLKAGQRIKLGQSAVSVTRGKPLKSTVFTVRLASGKTARYPLPQLLPR